MTCVSIETFHLCRFIVSLIVDLSTPLRGCMPQKGKQGLLKGSFKEYRDKNTSPRILGHGDVESDKDAKFVNIFLASFGLKPSLGKLSGHLGYLHSSLSLTSVFSSFVNKLLQAYMSYVFLFPFLQPISFISIHHNRYYHAHAAAKDPIHPSINLFRPSCPACDRKSPEKVTNSIHPQQTHSEN